MVDVLDLRTVGDGLLPQTDVCVIGSGPAGLVLAEELGRAGVRVLVLESGGMEDSPAADALNEVENVGHPREPDQRNARRRVLGGTSSVWAGRIAALDPVDFEPRPWVARSGWPVPRAALDGYWARAARYLGGPVDDNAAPGAVEGLRLGLPALQDPLVPYAWSFAARRLARDEPRLGPLALQRRAPLTVLVHATVTRLLTGPDGARVDGVEVATPDGRGRVVLHPRRVVLCAGGVENARLLLASRATGRVGVGNGHDQVGRGFMDHLRGTVAVFDRVDGRMMHRLSADAFRTAGGRHGRVKPGVALAPALQRREGLLNCAAYVEAIPSRTDPAARLMRVRRGDGTATDLLAAAGDWPLLLRGAGSMLVGRRTPVRRLARATLECIVEQPPDPASRVTLTERTDRLGVPLARIDWRVGDAERRTVLALVEAVRREFDRLGVAETRRYEPAFAHGGLHLPDVAHPTGTTRMSLRPEDGVVDPDCRVHGVENLYVAGSSVFPTAGHANPTQTLVALAIRLADHLTPRTGRWR